MKTTPKHRGPWMHRVLITVFTILLTLLFHWLLGFIIRDIGTLPMTPFAGFEERYLDQALVDRASSLRLQASETARQIKNEQERQGLLRDSTTSSQQTMNQLLDIQRLTLEKGIALTPPELTALAESKELFLSNQKRYQALNENIAQLKEQERQLQEQLNETETALQAQRQTAVTEYEALRRRHHLKLASLKMLVLVPLIGIVGYLFVKRRNTIYSPLIYAAGLALVFRTGLVLHEHFPTRYFKYILLVVALAVVIQVLIYLLRTMAFPKKELLLKQYREAYEKFLCPICSYPIRRGPLRYMFWTSRTLKKLALPAASGADIDEPYTCPNCATKLFDQCDACQAVRHCLLPACEKCGAQRDPV